MRRSIKFFIWIAVVALFCRPSAFAAEEGGFEFHGYMRAGFDWNTYLANPESADLRLAQMPTDCHSRFGNEGNRSYIEPSFGYTWKKATSDQFWKMNLTWSTFYNEGANDAGDTSFYNREAYVVGGGFDFSPGVKFWVGNRYYGREYVPNLDWFYVNLIGYGAGVEDIPIGPGKLNIAWIASHIGSDAWVSNNLLYDDSEHSEKVGELQENNLDFSVHSYPISDKVTLKVELSIKQVKGGYIPLDDDGVTENFEIKDRIGLFFFGKDQLGFFLLAKASVEGIGDFSGMYLNGASASKGPGGWSDSFLREIGRELDTRDFDENNELDYSDRFQYRFIYTGAFNFGKIDMEPYFASDYYNNGESGDIEDARTLLDIGVRGRYNLNQYFGFILDMDYAYQIREEGLASTDPDGDSQNPAMLKITPAIALTNGTGLGARPELRFYTTFATWNSDAKGDLAELATKEDDTSYLKFGFQCEAWW